MNILKSTKYSNFVISKACPITSQYYWARLTTIFSFS